MVRIKLHSTSKMPNEFERVLVGPLASLIDHLQDAGITKCSQLADFLGPTSEARLREVGIPIPLRRSFLHVCENQEVEEAEDDATGVPAQSVHTISMRVVTLTTNLCTCASG